MSELTPATSFESKGHHPVYVTRPRSAIYNRIDQDRLSRYFADGCPEEPKDWGDWVVFGLCAVGFLGGIAYGLGYL